VREREKERVIIRKQFKGGVHEKAGETTTIKVFVYVDVFSTLISVLCYQKLKFLIF
jgi:hypothetical protein